MESTTIYRDGAHRWIYMGRDPGKPEALIDTNQYVVTHGQEAILLDPGGVELFTPMLAAVLRYVPLEQIRYLFASHQDPDIISSLGLWDKALGDATLYAPWLWEGFIRHFGMEAIRFQPIPDPGMSLSVGGLELLLVPAHFLHASGNFHVYDPKARILMSGDVGASLEPDGAPLYVEDFERHIGKMKGFHQRWMPSNAAKKVWIERVRKLDIDMICPQHGRIFQGEMVTRFLDWFDALEVGLVAS